MSRRKRMSLRKLKKRFLLGAPLAVETILNTPRLDVFVTKHGYRMNHGSRYLVRLDTPSEPVIQAR